FDGTLGELDDIAHDIPGAPNGSVEAIPSQSRTRLDDAVLSAVGSLESCRIGACDPHVVCERLRKGNLEPRTGKPGSRRTAPPRASLDPTSRQADATCRGCG